MGIEGLTSVNGELQDEEAPLANGVPCSPLELATWCVNHVSCLEDYLSMPLLSYSIFSGALKL